MSAYTPVPPCESSKDIGLRRSTLDSQELHIGALQNETAATRSPRRSFGPPSTGENAAVTDRGLRYLRRLTKIQSLGIDLSAEVTDAGLAYLADMKRLSMLMLSDTQITDAGLRYLEGMQELDVLRLDNTPVTDRGLDHLVTLKKLRILRLKRFIAAFLLPPPRTKAAIHRHTPKA